MIISNASPLIGLSKIKRLHLLKELWSEIVIPEAVHKEVVIRGAGKTDTPLIAEACKSWIHTVSVKNRNPPARRWLFYHD